jgi:Neurotransmitter-gated ion-channel ligand binding domain
MYSLVVSTVILTIIIMVNGEMDDDNSFFRAESTLRSDLLGNYNRELLPKVNRSEIMNITYFVFLKRIKPHKNFKVTVYGTFMFSWNDEFLVYADKNPQQIRSLRVMTHEIWVSGTKNLKKVSDRSIKPDRFLT